MKTIPDILSLFSIFEVINLVTIVTLSQFQVMTSLIVLGSEISSFLGKNCPTLFINIEMSNPWIPSSIFFMYYKYFGEVKSIVIILI